MSDLAVGIYVARSAGSARPLYASQDTPRNVRRYSQDHHAFFGSLSLQTCTTPRAGLARPEIIACCYFGEKLRCGLPTRLPSWPPSETTGTDRVDKEQRANMTNDAK